MTDNALPAVALIAAPRGSGDQTQVTYLTDDFTSAGTTLDSAKWDTSYSTTGYSAGIYSNVEAFLNTGNAGSYADTTRMIAKIQANPNMCIKWDCKPNASAGTESYFQVVLRGKAKDATIQDACYRVEFNNQYGNYSVDKRTPTQTSLTGGGVSITGFGSSTWMHCQLSVIDSVITFFLWTTGSRPTTPTFTTTDTSVTTGGAAGFVLNGGSSAVTVNWHVDNVEISNGILTGYAVPAVVLLSAEPRAVGTLAVGANPATPAVALLAPPRTTGSGTVNVQIGTTVPAVVPIRAPQAFATPGDVPRISRNLQYLRRNNAPWRAAGCNAYWLALNDNTQSGGYATYPSKATVDASFDNMLAMGIQLVRVHTIGISFCKTKTMMPTLGTWDSTAVDKADYVIAAAKEHGIYLTMPLTDRWNFYHGGGLSMAQAVLGGSATISDFYTSSSVITAFKSYVNTLLNHVNPYTGLAWKDDPVFAYVECGNEIYDCGTTWTANIAAYIRSIAPKMLIADGTGASGMHVSSSDITDSNIDIVTGHFYPDYGNVGGADDCRMGLTWLATDAASAASNIKVYGVGEYDWTDASNNGSTAPTVPPYRATWLSTIEGDPRIAFDMWWTYLHPNAGTHRDGFELYYPSPENTEQSNGYTALKNHASYMSGAADYATPAVALLTAAPAFGGSGTTSPATPAVALAPTRPATGALGITGTSAPATALARSPSVTGTLGITGTTAPGTVLIGAPPAVGASANLLTGTPTPATVLAPSRPATGTIGITGTSAPAVVPTSAPAGTGTIGLTGTAAPGAVIAGAPPASGGVAVIGTPVPVTVLASSPRATGTVGLTGTPSPAAVLAQGAPPVGVISIISPATPGAVVVSAPQASGGVAVIGVTVPAVVLASPVRPATSTIGITGAPSPAVSPASCPPGVGVSSSIGTMAPAVVLAGATPAQSIAILTGTTRPAVAPVASPPASGGSISPVTGYPVPATAPVIAPPATSVAALISVTAPATVLVLAGPSGSPRSTVTSASDSIGITEPGYGTGMYGGYSYGSTSYARRTMALPRSVADGIGVAETATRTVAMVRSASDGIAIAESATRATALSRPVTDGTGVGETATRTTALSRPVTDGIVVAESPGRVTALSRTLTDGVAISDTATRVPTAARSVGDGVSVAESASRTATSGRAVTDGIAVAESASKTTGTPRSAADNLGIADAATRIPAAVRTVSDSLGIGESLVRSVTTTRAAADAAGIGETVTRCTVVSRVTSDSLGVGDAATRTASSTTRSAVDPIMIADAASRSASSRSRSATDGVTITDTASRVRGRAVIASDTLTITDSATSYRHLRAARTVVIVRQARTRVSVS